MSLMDDVERLESERDDARAAVRRLSRGAEDSDTLVRLLRAQLAEAQQLLTQGSVCEIGATNVNVASYMREWETRATQAEAVLAEAQRYWIDTNVPCGELPEGWQLDIRLERGAGSVVLFDPEGHEMPFDFGDLTLKEQVGEAVARAKEGSDG